MATTQTVGDVTQEVIDLWVKSYQGEVLGEAYFSHLARNTVDPGHRAKLDVLTALECCTKELLAPTLTRLGISTDPDPAIIEGVSKITDFDYERMVSGLPAVVADYLVSYSRLRELVAPEDAHTVDLLIAHELALEVFARREVAGETGRSLEPIRALAHVAT